MFAPQLTPLVGREDELRQIAELLADPACRLLTLVGPAGIGKTRLVRAAAQRFRERSYFVSLQSVTSPDFIVSTIADALGLQFYPGDDPRLQLLNFFQDKAWLLVLDNFEQLLEGTALLTEMLTNAADLRLLVTSRERLNLVEEWVLEVGGLTYPGSTSEADPGQYSAVALFVQQARRVKADFKLMDQNRDAAIRICRLVGGMPLGIELAATRVRVLSCAAIAEEIESSLDILETSARNVEERHRTMRAAFEPTWVRLSEEEREVFMKLSVFRGGFTRESARTIAQASLNTLSALLDKSLLRLEPNGRYDLHELLRQYGEERLKASGEEAARVRDLHCNYYAEFISQRTDALIHGNPKRAAAEIDQDLENVRMAWNRMVTEGKAELIEQTSIPLIGFYLVRGLYQEGAMAFGHAANSLREQGSFAFALTLSHQARCIQYLGDYEQAAALYRQALALHLHLGIAAEASFCLERLTEIAGTRGDYDAARRYIEETQRISAEINDKEPWRQAFILPLAGHIAFMTGDPLEARRWYAEALVASEAYTNDIAMTDAWYYLGNADLALGAYADAQQAYQESLRVAREIDHDLGCIDALAGLGEVALRRHAYSDAQQYCREALQMTQQKMLVHGPTIRILLTAAELLIEQAQYEWAAILVGLALHHPVSEQCAIERARKLLPRLQTELHPQQFAAACEHGKSSEIHALMSDLLAKLTSSAHVPMRQSAPSLTDPLSARELDILRLVAEGYSNQEIADRLVIGISTVKKHINHVYDKLDVKNRTQAVACARARDLLA